MEPGNILGYLLTFFPKEEEVQLEGLGAGDIWGVELTIPPSFTEWEASGGGGVVICFTTLGTVHILRNHIRGSRFT